MSSPATGTSGRALGVGRTEDGRGVGQAVEHVADRGLDERRLLLDHQHLVQAARELAQQVALDRVDHAEPQQPDPGPAQVGVGEAEVGAAPAGRR